MRCYFFFIYICFCLFFFFNDTATTEIYTLSLHDALPIYLILGVVFLFPFFPLLMFNSAITRWCCFATPSPFMTLQFFTSFICPLLRSEEHTSELQSQFRISYAVFCLKKKTPPPPPPFPPPPPPRQNRSTPRYRHTLPLNSHPPSTSCALWCLMKRLLKQQHRVSQVRSPVSSWV